MRAQARTLNLFGKTVIIKRNPWTSKKLAQAVSMGLARVKKDYILAVPPPWAFDPNALSEAQITQIMRFSQASHDAKGKTVVERLREIKAKASGPTGKAKIVAKQEMPRINRILTVAQRKYGIGGMAPIPTPTPLKRVVE